jgi:hypothetical protein
VCGNLICLNSECEDTIKGIKAKLKYFGKEIVKRREDLEKGRKKYSWLCFDDLDMNWQVRL